MSTNPGSSEAMGTQFGHDEQDKVNAINNGDLDAALDALDRQQAALHPPASGTPDVGNASGTQNLNP